MNRDDLRDVLALLAPVKRKLALVASRCVASIVRDSTAMQNAQVQNLADEVFDPIEHMQPGGLTHVPLSGAEGIRITMSGVYDDSVVFAMSNRQNRPKDLGAGETALYNASSMQSTVTIRANGDVEVTLAAGAKLKVGGDAADYVALASKVDAALAQLEAHVHVSAAPGSPTGGPVSPPPSPSDPPGPALSFDTVAADLLQTA